MRITKKMIENKFRIFCELHELKVAESYNDKGAYYLDDYAPPGNPNRYIIECNVESGGISHPFGSLRLTNKEMYYALDFANSIKYKLKEFKK